MGTVPEKLPVHCSRLASKLLSSPIARERGDDRHRCRLAESPRRSERFRNIVLLAPGNSQLLAQKNLRTGERATHAGLLAEMQRLRARVALEEGAIQPDQLTLDGRHVQTIDSESWHVLGIDADGTVRGCARYRLHRHEVAVNDVEAWHSALAQSPTFRAPLWQAIEREIAEARHREIGFAEVGGWAVEQSWRCSSVPVSLALITFALAARLGHCIALTTASRKSSSASILRRLGGKPLRSGSVEFPPYFDPQYGCEMDLLRFDSKAPDDKYQSRLTAIKEELAAIRVLVAISDVEEKHHSVQAA